MTAKLHRFGFYGDDEPLWRRHDVNRSHYRTLCGRPVHSDEQHETGGVALLDAAFAWLPIKSQCIRCREASPGLPYTGNEQLRITALEVVLLELARLSAAASEIDSDDWRCWYSTATGYAFEPMPVHWYTRQPSWTDPRRWEWAIGSALSGSGEKFCYPHRCAVCGIGFRTERPRGVIAICGTCRGQPDRQQRAELRYTTVFDDAEDDE
jgi:hypothetical protein